MTSSCIPDVAIEKILAALAATRDGLGNPSATP
jgi:hypothetical protein